MSVPVLTLKDYGLANGDTVILNSATLEVAEKGLVNILGPTAAGKSTLIRMLSGINSSHPTIKTWGEVTYHGMPIGKAGYPAIVMQNSKLMTARILENILSDIPGTDDLDVTQQRETACDLLEAAKLGELVDCLDKRAIDLPLETMRHLAIARVCAANPRLVFIDEPTRSIENDRVHKLLDYIKAEGEKRAVVVVTKNKAQARFLGGRTVLLADGHVQEDAPTEELFSSPKTIATKEIIENDTYSALTPEQDAIQFSPVPVDIKNCKKAIHAPEGFVLLKKGEIAGLPKSGIDAGFEQDLGALQKSGVTHLISLTSEAGSIDPDILAKYGISLIYEPIDDMSVPTVERASHISEEIGHLIGQSNVVAIHCLSGSGRTGLVLALHLIWEGLPALQAIETVRELNPKWVQSEAQVLFLQEFAYETAGEVEFANIVVENKQKKFNK